MQRVLDLGCGTGESYRGLGSSGVEDWRLVGVDVLHGRLQQANHKYEGRGWHYVCGTGESVPLQDNSMAGAICRVALPYMRIPQALKELNRVLVPGGWVKLSVHPPGFTVKELKRSFPRPVQSLFRSFVLLNGMYFHFTGNVMSLAGSWESCQTESGMRIALARAGFRGMTFKRAEGRLLVEAQKAGALMAMRHAA